MDLVVVPERELKKIIKSVISDALDNVMPPPWQYNDPDKRLTIKDLCDKYNISKPTVHKHMHKGLPYEKLGRKTLFRTADIESYFRSKKRGGQL